MILSQSEAVEHSKPSIEQEKCTTTEAVDYRRTGFSFSFSL
jgi:hypothetical protein